MTSINSAMHLHLGSYQQNLTDDQYYIDYNLSNVSYEYDDNEKDITTTFAFKLGAFFVHYYTPVLVPFGVIGNILSVVVLLKTEIRKLSSSYYLAALGISDTCFLLIAFVSWLNFVKINIYNRNHFCQFFTYVSGLCCFLSVWLIVAFTVERYIVVLHPLKRPMICTRKRACFLLTGLIIVGCVFCFPQFKFAEPKYSKFLDDFICDVQEEFKVRIHLRNKARKRKLWLPKR